MIKKNNKLEKETIETLKDLPLKTEESKYRKEGPENIFLCNFLFILPI